jgi:hypothetical protein
MPNKTGTKRPIKIEKANGNKKNKKKINKIHK